MPKYSIGCEGSKEEFYAFLLDLSQKIQWATRPWEHPTVEQALYKKEEVETIPSQPVSQDTPVSPEELRAKSIAFGKAGGQKKMKEFLVQLGVKKLSELDAAQRVTMSKLIDEASRELQRAIITEAFNAE